MAAAFARLGQTAIALEFGQMWPIEPAAWHIGEPSRSSARLPVAKKPQGSAAPLLNGGQALQGAFTTRTFARCAEIVNSTCAYSTCHQPSLCSCRQDIAAEPGP